MTELWDAPRTETPIHERPFYSGRVAKDPITGESKKETLKDFAEEQGWTFRYTDASGWLFRKDGRTLHVPTYHGHPLGGVLHEAGKSGGLRVERTSLKDILTGTRCICDPRNLDAQFFPILDPDCPVEHQR